MWKSSLLATSIAITTLTFATLAQAQFRRWGSEGTIIGRVFVDRNGDGEKQADEPGIAKAVIFTDDGLRVTSDEYGRFTIPNVYPGYRSAVLDLSSIPGYQIAANPRISDSHSVRVASACAERLRQRNSPSRMVRVAPGSLARMNFACAIELK
jgi:hypothetical protein